MGAEQVVSPFSQFFPIILIFLVFYFIVFKPEKDKRKKLKELVDTMKKNDQVITTSGIHGRVVLVKEKTVVVRVDDNTKIEFEKDAVNAVVSNKNKEEAVKK